MNRVPCIPDAAPFTPEQRAWLNGYLAGLFADANVGESRAGASPSGPLKKESLLVMFGSQTGTAEGLAKRVARQAEERGFAPQVLEMNEFASVDFAKEQWLVLITSTWGDGDPPDNAVAFWQHLCSDAPPKLDHLNYSVLALGDKNYSEFCGAGKKFDERLEQLGARRVHPRGECDVDYEAAARAWTADLWPALESAGRAVGLPLKGDPSRAATASRIASSGLPANPESIKLPEPHHNRNNPFPARLLANRRLNAPGSAKDTRHLEISLDGSGLVYEVGDALGVMPANCPTLADEIVRALGCDGEEAVNTPDGKEVSLRNALLQSYQITPPSRDLLAAVAGRSSDATLNSLLDPARKHALDEWLDGREIIDLLLDYPAARFNPGEFVALLRKLQPRLYSIASSPKAHPGEAHLTVAIVRYESRGRQRKGVCSTFLADRVETERTPVPVFVQTSLGFRLPADDGHPMVMIGPGTGVAPFRAFLEERRAVGAKGKNWLFFGDQREACDFLYREEFQALLEQGALARLDTAFSRDQERKIYVQQRMAENAGVLWAWLEEGAHFYVCGDAKRMAKDVDAALHDIIRKAGGKSADQAAEYVQMLKTRKRYQRDVY